MGSGGSVPLGSSWGGLSRVLAPGVTPGWAQGDLCPWDHPGMGSVGSLPLGSPWGGLSKVLAPGITPGWAQGDLCPWNHPEVDSVGSLPLGSHQGGFSGISAPGFGSAGSLPLRPRQDVLIPSTPTLHPNCHCKQRHPHPPTATTTRQQLSSTAEAVSAPQAAVD